MTQPTKREQLAAMRLEDFKAHLRTIAGEDPKREISSAHRPNPVCLVEIMRFTPDESFVNERRARIATRKRCGQGFNVSRFDQDNAV